MFNVGDIVVNIYEDDIDMRDRRIGSVCNIGGYSLTISVLWQRSVGGEYGTRDHLSSIRHSTMKEKITYLKRIN